MKNIALPRTVKAPAAVIAALLMLAGILFAPPSPAVARPIARPSGQRRLPVSDRPRRLVDLPVGRQRRRKQTVPHHQPRQGRAGQGCRLSANGHDLKGFDRARFGWTSTQDGGAAPAAPANRATWN